MILKKYKYLIMLLLAILFASLCIIGVSADDETPTVPIDPPDVTDISLKALPSKTFYLVGEKLDMSGAELELTYDTGAKGSSPVKLDWTSGFNSSKEGEQTVTITYPGTKCKTTFKVEIVSEKSIKVVLPKTVTYFVGDSEDRGGLSVFVVYSNNKTLELAPTDYTVKGFSTDTAGEKTITVTYKKLTETYNITVFEPALTTLAILKKPNKLSYYVGETLDISGLDVIAYYENGKTANVTSKVTVNCDISSAGTKTVTVSYTEGDRVKNATYQVSVIGIEIRNIVFASYPQKTVYLAGESFDPAGISVTVTYNNGKVETVSDGLLYTGFDSSTVGEKTVTLHYGGFQLDFTVRVGISSSHVHTEGEYKVTREPTCTKNGVESTSCTVCFEVVSTKSIAAKGHGSESMPIQIKAPTCTESGATSTYCMDCGDSVTVAEIAPLGHTAGAPQYIVTPTCTEGGLTKVFCTVCKAEVSSHDLQAYGHAFSSWMMKIEPTGENDGREERACSVCSLVESNIISKLVHTLTSGSFSATLGGESLYFPYSSNFYGACVTDSLDATDISTLAFNSGDGKVYKILDVFDLAVSDSKGEAYVPDEGIIFTLSYALPRSEYSSFIVYDSDMSEVLYFSEEDSISIVCEGNGRYVLAGEVIPESTEPQTEADTTESENTDNLPVSGNASSGNDLMLTAMIVVAIILIIILAGCIYIYLSKRYY